jgi:predicted ABC-type ATPase
LVFAGPNGSGKSTATKNLRLLGTYVNADELKEVENLTDLEAAQKAEAIREQLLRMRESFTFETVMSTERNLELLRRAKEQGYEVQCIYVLTSDVRINVMRVKARVENGGHNVPEPKIRERYQRALSLIPQLISICDEMVIYDNSDKPEMVFSRSGLSAELFPNQRWTESKLRILIGMTP